MKTEKEETVDVAYWVVIGIIIGLLIKLLI